MESNRPFVLSDSRFKDVVESNLTELLQKRYDLLSDPIRASTSTHTIRDMHGNSFSITSREMDMDVLVSLLAAKGFHISSTKQLARLHEHGECSVELSVVAAVEAYFAFSTERVCDVVSQLFENVFVREFVSRLKKSLVVELGLVGEHGHTKCVGYAKDEPQIEQEREGLKKQKDILLAARNVISQFY
jgi:Dynamin GTPase effector domain